MVFTLAMRLAAQTPAGSAFSYQGRLTDGGVPANGTYDLRFTLFDVPAGGSGIATAIERGDVHVTGGLFSVMLDFGAVFAGQARWIEIEVRPGASSGAFTALAPRQAITPAPHALFGQAATWNSVINRHASLADGIDNDTLATLACTAGQLPTWTGTAWTCALPTDTLAALACAPGQDPRWNGAAWTCAPDQNTLALLACAAGQLPRWTGAAWACATDDDGSWSLTGNAGTFTGSAVGTTDAAPLELRTNNVPALRLLPGAAADDPPAMLGGDAANTVTAIGGVIAGGGTRVSFNTAGAYGAIGGGIGHAATIGGIVSGGQANGAGDSGAVVGGQENSAASRGAVLGGRQNRANAQGSAIGGGLGNRTGQNGATVPGGAANHAGSNFAGLNSFAAGTSATVQHDGTFVWLGSNGGPASVAPNQFLVLVTGDIWFGDSSVAPTFPGFLNTSTGAYLSHTGIWVNASDRNLKEHFEPIDGRALLDRLARLPITRWNYRNDPLVQHIGPTSQDFAATFDLRGDDKTINTLDPAGIALRAIQEIDDAQRALQHDSRVLIDAAEAARVTLENHAARIAALQSKLP